jgi:hypothetical protein
MTKMTGLMLLALLAVACSGGRDDRPGHARAACERYVELRLKTTSATFSGEQVEVGKARATVKGMVDFAMASPAPNAPMRMRQSFTCSVEEKDWRLVALTGLVGP